MIIKGRERSGTLKQQGPSSAQIGIGTRVRPNYDLGEVHWRERSGTLNKKRRIKG